MTGFWDIHNHILPGVDDGSSCMEETIEMLRDEYDQGVRHLILTPHYRKDMFEIEEEPRRRVFAQLQEVYDTRLASELPGMTFALGCELHLHPSQSERAQKPIYRMPTAGMNRDLNQNQHRDQVRNQHRDQVRNQHQDPNRDQVHNQHQDTPHPQKIVLAEFSGRDDYTTIAAKLQEMREAGFTCIIAHAERYRLSAEDIRKLKDLSRHGQDQRSVYIQVNAGSILGKEGLHQRLLTHKLLDKNLVDFIGSDAHNVSTRIVNIGPCAAWITKKYGAARTEKLLAENPEAMFGC